MARLFFSTCLSEGKPRVARMCPTLPHTRTWLPPTAKEDAASPTPRCENVQATPKIQGRWELPTGRRSILVQNETSSELDPTGKPMTAPWSPESGIRKWKTQGTANRVAIRRVQRLW